MVLTLGALAAGGIVWLVGNTILPNERAAESRPYPALARPLGSDETTAAMSPAHAEIRLLADRIGARAGVAQSAGRVLPDQVDDLLARLYGLYGRRQLHFVQEGSNCCTLAEDDPTIGKPTRKPGPAWRADPTATG